MPVKRIPKGCPDCGNQMLELYHLILRCLKCGWSRDLQGVNDFIQAKTKRRK